MQHIKAENEENIDILCKHFTFSTRLDFYYAIAMQQINIQDLNKYFTVENSRLVEKDLIQQVHIEREIEKIPETKALPEAKRKQKTDIKPRLLINGESADQYEYSLASCCNPVLGDDVFAYLTTNAGMKIHRTACPNATNLWLIMVIGL